MEDIDISYFGVYYFGCSYPNAYDKEEDVSVSELMQEVCTEESRSWRNALTGYRGSIMNYLSKPVKSKISKREKAFTTPFLEAS